MSGFNWMEFLAVACGIVAVLFGIAAGVGLTDEKARLFGRGFVFFGLAVLAVVGCVALAYTAGGAG